jgi:hypothetical protein
VPPSLQPLCCTGYLLLPVVSVASPTEALVSVNLHCHDHLRSNVHTGLVLHARPGLVHVVVIVSFIFSLCCTRFLSCTIPSLPQCWLYTPFSPRGCCSTSTLTLVVKAIVAQAPPGTRLQRGPRRTDPKGPRVVEAKPAALATAAARVSEQVLRTGVLPPVASDYRRLRSATGVVNHCCTTIPCSVVFW